MFLLAIILPPLAIANSANFTHFILSLLVFLFLFIIVWPLAWIVCVPWALIVVAGKQNEEKRVKQANDLEQLELLRKIAQSKDK